MSENTSSSKPRLTRRQALRAAGVLGIGGVVGTVSGVYLGEGKPGNPDIIGHRGAAALAPANTIAAIEAGLQYDVDGIELDVRRTSDGTLVLFHDPILDWATDDGHGRVHKTSWDELQHIRFHGEPIPTLSEGLALLAETDVDIYLEMKRAGYTDAVLDEVESFGLTNRVTITSFEQEALPAAQRRGVETGLLGKLPNPYLLHQGVSADTDAVSSHYSPHGLEWFMENAQEKGLRGGVWHLTETTSVLEDVLDANPDHITTNRPDLAVELLNNR